MQVYFKVTGWELVTIPEEIEREVIQKIKNGEITSANELFSKMENDDLMCDFVADTSEQMPLADNDGYSTIEIIKENKKLYENGTTVE